MLGMASFFIQNGQHRQNVCGQQSTSVAFEWICSKTVILP